MGLDHFLAGLRDYFQTHAFGNAGFSDLLSALEKASGRDLSNWGKQWLKTTGLNTLRPDFDVDDDGKFTRFAVTQSGAAPGAGETRVHRVAVGIYDDDPDGSGKLVRVHREELDVDGSSTEVPALVGISRGKLVLVNDDDLTYCSLRLDAESLQTALDRIADIAEPLPRTLAWSAAWEMTREAELRARDFVSLVSGGIQAETEVTVAQRLLVQAQTAVGSYAEPGWAREHGWPQLADRLLELARDAAPGSDHQLVFVNALCSSVLSRRHLDVLTAVLDGDPAEQGLAGLDVDTDLRWRVVIALAAAGEIDAEGPESPRIDAQVQSDPTAAGKRHGAHASAARPQLKVKEDAFTTVVECMAKMEKARADGTIPAQVRDFLLKYDISASEFDPLLDEITMDLTGLENLYVTALKDKNRAETENVRLNGLIATHSNLIEKLKLRVSILENENNHIENERVQMMKQRNIFCSTAKRLYAKITDIYHSSAVSKDQHKKLLPFFELCVENADSLTFDCEKMIPSDCVLDVSYRFGVVVPRPIIAKEEYVKYVAETLTKSEFDESAGIEQEQVEEKDE